MELARWGSSLGAEPGVVLPGVHVNVSARHFAAPDLACTVSRALRRSGLPPDRLVLEIAETVFTGEGRVATEQFDGLRGIGVGVSLDRFGTRYSSLSAIRRLPFDALKIDSSLFEEIGEGVFEGPDGSPLRLLRSLGLERAQGTLFSPPLSGEAALELVRAGPVCTGLLEATRPVAADVERVGAPAPAGGARGAGAAAAGATLSLGQAAQALGISTTTVRRWADDGRLGTTRTAGGHRRFAAAEVRRLLAERGRPAVAPADPPPRSLPGLAGLLEEHASAVAELSWRGLYGDLGSGFFADADGRAAAERWTGALASAAATANYEMAHQATSALMRLAGCAGASLLERHLALERFCETVSRALSRRACPREEIAAVRRLFAFLLQRQLADAG